MITRSREARRPLPSPYPAGQEWGQTWRPEKQKARHRCRAPLAGRPMAARPDSVHRILQRLAGLERRILRRLDLDLLARARVATGAGATLAHLERAEADEGHAVALL